MEIEEIWRGVPGTEGMYEVSNLGNIRSVEGGDIKPVNSYVSKGICLVYLRLRQPNGKFKNMAKYPKRIVYESFGDQLLNVRLEVVNIDGDIKNNSIDNLMVRTRDTSLASINKQPVIGLDKRVLDGMAAVVADVFGITVEFLKSRDRRRIRTRAIKVLCDMWIKHCELNESYYGHNKRIDIVSRYVSVSRSTMNNHVLVTESLNKKDFYFTRISDLCHSIYFDGYKLTNKDRLFADVFNKSLVERSSYRAVTRNGKYKKVERVVIAPVEPITPMMAEYNTIPEDKKQRAMSMFDQEYSLGYIDNVLDMSPGMARFILMRRLEKEEEEIKD